MRMKIGKVACLVSVFVVLFGLTATGWAQAPKTLTMGIATPLTGPAANVGANYRNAVLLAMEHQNAKGGVTIGGQKYLIDAITRDTKFDVTVAKTVSEELVFDKKVKIIFGASPVEMASMQAITEPNKILLFGMSPIAGQVGPEKPYTFILGGYPDAMYTQGALYIKEHHPQATKVASTYADLPDMPMAESAAKNTMSRFGFTWLGMEKWAAGTSDFSAVIQKILAKKPDVVDTSMSGGAMGAVLPILVKQLRQAGFDGVIWMPAVPPPGVMEEAVSKAYLNKIVTNDIDLNSPICTKAYKDLYAEYVAKYKNHPIDLMGWVYDGTTAFFNFLNTKKSMDTAVWLQGFEKYRWKNVFGFEGRWVGKPVFGNNRFMVATTWVSEWKDGKLSNMEAPPNYPWQIFESK